MLLELVVEQLVLGLLQSHLVFELVDLLLQLDVLVVDLLCSLFNRGRPCLVLIELVLKLLDDSVVVPDASGLNAGVLVGRVVVVISHLCGVH